MKHYTLIILSLLLLCACKKKTGETFNYDPCEGKIPFKADFKILEDIGDYTAFAWLETDTAFTGRIRFQSIGSYDSIIWQIAFDNRQFKNQTEVTLLFSTSGSYIVKMIGYKKPYGCFLNEKKCDTITKKIILVTETDSLGNQLRKGSINGSWKGYVVGRESNLFTVTIKSWPFNGNYIKNLPQGVMGFSSFDGNGVVPPYSGFRISSGYKNIAFDANFQQTYAAKGVGSLNDFNTIKIEFSHIDTTIPNWKINLNPVRINSVFIGKRQ